MPKMNFLRYVVSEKGISVNAGKMDAVMQWDWLKIVFEIRSFLGLTGYYRRFLHNFFRIVAPMTRLTRKDVKFV